MPIEHDNKMQRRHGEEVAPWLAAIVQSSEDAIVVVGKGLNDGSVERCSAIPPKMPSCKTWARRNFRRYCRGDEKRAVAEGASVMLQPDAAQAIG